MQPYQLATTSLVVPVVAVLEGAFFREQIPLTMVIVIIIVLASVGTVLRAEAGAGSEEDFILLRGKTP